VFRYRPHSPDGDDLGDATYAVMIKPGEEILVGNGRRLRVLAVVPFAEEDHQSPLVGLLRSRPRRFPAIADPRRGQTANGLRTNAAQPVATERHCGRRA